MNSEELLNKASELLSRAVRIWSAAELSRRDASLEVGRLLHAFVIAYLCEGDELLEARRIQEGRTRHKAVCEAAEQLCMDFIKVNWLIATAMAADLLSDKGQLGIIGWGSIKRFVRFVRRQTGTSSRNGADTLRLGRDVPLSSSEEWEIRPQFVESAPAFFQRAVAEKWTNLQTRQRVMDLGGRIEHASRSPRPRLSATSPPPGKNGFPVVTNAQALAALKSAVKVGSPQDVAELLFEVVSRAEDPAAVVNHLQQMVRDAKADAAKKRPTFAGSI